MSDSEERFQEIADFAPVGIAVIDAVGSARYVNHRLAEITHVPEEGLLELDLKPLLVPDEGHQHRCQLDIEAGSPCVVEVALRWMTDGDNRPTGAVAIIDDVSGQRGIDLTHLAAGLAHEFDDALTSMLTTNGEHGHGDPPAPPSFDVNDLIRATLPPIVDQEAAITLTLRLAEPPAPVHMDPSQLAEALRYLTINAIEAMPGRGRIAITASRARKRPTGLPDGEFVHISVVDDGRGMAAESLEHAIEPFFTTKVGAPWVGLGLATTYGIVNRAGGRMSITSEPGVGTSVHLYVPAGPPPGDEAAGDALLLVDDNQDLRMLATRLLTTAGYEVLTAAGGIEAMAILRDRTFDCLVTDIAMPDMGGIDLAENVRAIAPDMPVVFVSGFVNIAPGAGGPLPENAHTLIKPYTAQALTAAVRRAMKARA